MTLHNSHCCILLLTGNWAITGDLIGPNHQLDTDGDDIGDACDPDPYTITGHMHLVTLTQGVPIFNDGVKLNNLGGPWQVKNPGARTYSVDVSNLGSASEDIQVALRVAGGCGTVNDAAEQNTSVVSVGPEASGSALTPGLLRHAQDRLSPASRAKGDCRRGDPV